MVNNLGDSDGGKQLKNPSGRAAETNYLGRHQMFINVSLLPVCILCQKAFQFRSLDSAAVKCLECFLLSFGLFSFLKKPRVAQAQARRLSMRKQDTAGPEIVPFPSSSCGSLLLPVGESLTCYRHLSSCCCRSSRSHAAVDLSQDQEYCFGWRGFSAAGG